MISTDLKRVQIQDIVAHQLPSFVREDFPLITEFLKQYYISQEYPGASVDLIQNIDQYLKLETLTDNTDSTKLSSAVSFNDTTINVGFDLSNNILGTYGFPEKYGLIKIDNEIILYTSKTNNSFVGCVRGFSGVTSYTKLDTTDGLTFSTSEIAEHSTNTSVINLSNLLLKEFLTKIKYQFTPGFENRNFDADVNDRLFISRAKDFYQTKGTDESFKILFGALYGEKVDVIKPRNYLFRPSDAQYRITKDIVVDSLSGNPLELLNQTLFQEEYSNYGIQKAYASITDVEKLFYGGKEYYKLSVDFDYSKDITFDGSVFGDFSVHPKTRVVTKVSAGSSVIDVDSTVGFPHSGELVVNYSATNIGIVSYTSKSTNQFFGVSNITSDIASATDIRLNAYAYGYVGVGTASKVEVRIGSVLSNLEVQDQTYYFSKNDTATIKSLGITTSGPRVDSWIYNLATKYDIKSIAVTDISSFTYRATTFVRNNFKVGDNLFIIDSFGVSKECFVSDVINDFTFSIKGQGFIDTNKIGYKIERKILKPQVSSLLTNYSYVSKYTSNVQNTYVKFNQDVLVAASSIPNYYNQPLSFYDRKITLSGSYSGEVFTVSNVSDHGYYTGDAVYYSPFVKTEIIDGSTVTTTSKFSNMQEGIYYVKRLANPNQFKLASSQANLYNNKFISVSGIVTSNTLQYADFYNKELQHQNLLREIKTPSDESGNYTTDPGKTGILVNGVEILNYKSEDTIYYGSLNDIIVSAKGSNYDIINPPILAITDRIGTGATGVCAVKGSLQKIDVIDSGFDYIAKPIVTITGGNGYGAKADVNTTFVDHSVSFNATSESAFVNLSADTIGFSTYHKFRNAEKVVYKTDNQTAVSGIVTDAVYFVKTIDAFTIKLYNTESDAISGLNTVSLTNYGSGVHRIQSFDKKQIVSNIVVVDPGTNYENKKRTVSSSGINTASNQINIRNHQYNSGEVVTYSYNETPISGLSSSTSYIITKVDEDNFKLSSVGVGSISKLFYFNNRQYINLESVGSGSHIFNYEPISVSIVGEIGVSTFAGQDFSAKIQPVFRGSIESVQVTNPGVGYGVTDILNYNRQPSFILSSGSSAELLPIINNGRIVEVLVTNEGRDYNSPPELIISGSGKYGKLVPVISEGKIKSVKIESPGIGYEEKTRITIVPSGSGASFNADIQKWTINLFEKYLNIISDDDGILTKSSNEEFGVQYSHLYAPRKLRESVYGKDQDNQVKYGVFDLQKVNGEEVSSQYHSPIIGWAYDGNPIYGPYGFSTKTGGSVRAMKSGYAATVKPNRPPYAQGFFVEDFEFNNSGDLDEHNGRFCVTPDFPNGVYAYFATINPDRSETSSAFSKYRIPVFPYLIGNSFKSKPNSFNYDSQSNQISYDLNSSSWFRNTTPYNLTETGSYYDFLFQPNKIKSQTININESSRGSIDSVGIVTGGLGYKVGDTILFDDQQYTQKTKAKVTRILGKPVTNISVATTTISHLEIIPFDSSGSYIAFATTPHGLLNNDLVSLSGFNTSISHLQSNFNIGVNTERLILNTGVGTAGVTGVVTYFNVSGNIKDDNLFSIRENDIISVGSEKVKVLNVDILNSRIRVLRSQQNTVSSAHTASTLLNEDSRKFTFTALPENEVTFELNKEIYFNPKESIALGSLSGVGIGTTLSFSNPGAGISQIFVPTRSIYLPNHNLKTGDVLSYHNNGGTSISVSTNGSVGYALSDLSIVYVGKISNDLIGISTYKIGIGSTGTFVGIASTTLSTGLLYFTGIGTNVYHSFKTVKQNVVTAEANKNVVTVSVASTHGLSINDSIDVEVNPGITTVVIVKYDDHNRRIVFNPKSFTSGDVDVLNNTITINDHGFNSGDKVIYTATTPSGGLTNEGIYYVFRFNKDKVKLCLNRYQSLQFSPEVVDISSASSGTLSPINPPLSAYKNNTIKFDLSDSSLSSLSGSTLYSAFDFNLYSDSQFTNVFDSSQKSNSFEVLKTGQIGITANAALTLKVTNSLPEVLYYKFSPINSQFVSSVKKEIYIDDEVLNSNQIKVTNSLFNGSFNITGIGTTSTFTYNLQQLPEKSNYTSDNSTLKYTTNSSSANGGISDISISYSGKGYQNIVGVSTIKSLNGSDAILESSSKSIGKIVSNQIEDIGFDFPTDKTLRPVCNLPEILLMQPLSSFNEIGITSAGKNYTIAPKLVVVDGYTGKVVDDVDLSYNIGDTKVKILKNTFGIYNTTPKIIPTNNQNGIGINNISYNSVTKEVSVGLNTGFSDFFPFSVGDKVLIENVSVGVATTGFGYNSANYNYSLFTLTKVPAGASALGGSVGVVTYSLDGLLKEGTIPGNYDPLRSSGRIIAEKDFPVFDIKLKKNDFILGETVSSNNNTGKVESWNNEIELLKVSTTKDFNVGDVLVGQTSRTQGAIKSKIDFNAEIKTGPTSIVKKGWNRETGFLNYNTERISDNNYYQNFSYSLKSKVPFETWNDSVSSLNHTSGFLKFSDLIIESQDSNFKGVSSNYRGGDIDIVVDIYDEVDINCYSNFDLVTENSLNAGGSTISDEIYFNSKVLTDYFESFGNRVLIIDDISTQFNSDPRPTRYSIVDTFDANHRYKKYFTYVVDKRFTGERQFLIVSLLQNGSEGYLNQYGRVESQLDLGSFDFSISGTEGQLLFYPTKYAVNNYNISFASFDLDSSISGIGSTDLGDVVKIKSSRASAPASTATTIVSFASTYRASKVLVEIEGNNGQFESNEINVIHNGTDVEFLDYGQLTDHSADAFSSSGLGTYNAYISGGNVNIDFTPNVGVAATVSAVTVSIASTLSTGIGTQYLGFDSENIAFVDSSYTSIASTSSPTENIIARYSNTDPSDHTCAYYLISVEDTTNNQYEMSEVIVLNDGTNAYVTEYGNLITNSGLGTVGAAVSSSYTNLYYTPIPNINAQIRVFQLSLQLVDLENLASSEIDLNNSSISAGFGFYQGTETDVRRAFNLTYKQRPIFLRNFNGGSSSVVDTVEDTILLPEHFFVSGEEVVYSYDVNNASPIGIATTSFAGIGTTSILPSSVYIIKINDQKVKLARSAEDALKTVPNALNITNVGVGTYHTFTSKRQNSKCIIALDNYFQSPIVATSVTTGLTTHIGLVDDIIKFSGITSFFSGDLIQINNEIMKINTVGLGSTNFILVDRQWMGTGLSTHSEYSVVTKVQGNYNIVDSTINFITAPQGPIPIGSSTNAPDERDWSGITTFSKFQGRTFLRSGTENGSSETYATNYIFDDISEYFNATSKTFTLQVNKQNVTGFSTDNAVVLINGVFQGPTGQLPVSQDYSLSEGSGISSITFAGSATSVSYDPNNASIPIGGIIVSVGSTEGFGYQPLVSAGGTAIVSIAGTISSISIGNSGSGYRAGIQTTVRVGVTTATTGVPSIQFIGTAAISGGHIVSVAVTNPGTGYTSSNPPFVVFDSPLSYSDIPLIYSSSSPSGFGTQATIDIVVGQGSSVIDFEIKNFGYNYGQQQILTIAAGGLAGIPTDSTKPFKEFQLTIDKTISDEFAGWHLGQLEVLDKIENQFDGVKKSFNISLNSSPVTIRSAKGSNIDVQATLLVFLNDILQVPGEGYTFTGGSVVTFAEPPKGNSPDGSIIGDKCKILFYKGSGDVDVVFRDVLETVKVGDNLTVKGQEERLVTSVISSDTVETNPYNGGGIDSNPANQRTAEWCKQTVDKVINGQIISKSRILNEALINPTTNIIQSVGIGSTIVYVDSLKTFFDAKNENQTTTNRQKIVLFSQDIAVGASATAVVSAAGTISSIIINNGGVGYSTTPTVTIGNPIGFGTTMRSSASSTISVGGTVSSITITSPGFGYTTTNPPQVLIEVPETIYEVNTSLSYEGDFGVIVGVSTISVGVASTGIVFDFYIPQNSFLRDTSIVSAATTVSGIQTGYYFVVNSSNIGNGVTSLYQNSSVLGIATQFLDNVYEVASVSIAQTSVPGIALTYVTRVTTNVSSYNRLAGMGNSSFFGNFSWGRIVLGNRIDPKSFNAYTRNGSSGITTSAILTRVEPLKYINYS